VITEALLKIGDVEEENKNHPSAFLFFLGIRLCDIETHVIEIAIAIEFEIKLVSCD